MGGGQERGVRSGTENVPLAGSFAVALIEAQKNIEARVQKVTALRDVLFQEIQKNIPDVHLNGSTDNRTPNNCNISIPGLAGDMGVIALDALGVAASTRSACSAGDESPSHVIIALGTGPEVARQAIRLTLLPDATMSDAKYIAKALFEVAKRYKNMLQ